MRRSSLLVLVAAIAASIACGVLGSPPQRQGEVFTAAHSTMQSAATDYFGRHKTTVEQPIPFPHKTHVGKGLKCTEYCHESVTKGPIAGLPSVKTCMICHESIATDRPVIQKVADYYKRKEDIPWQRVFAYAAESHVKFNHAPHIRAGVECANCHGNIAEQTVAQRNIDVNMGYCVDCHRAKQASNDCLTCHF